MGLAVREPLGNLDTLCAKVGLVRARMETLTIHEAAATTGWSAAHAALPRTRRPARRRRARRPAIASTAPPRCSACAPCASCSASTTLGLSDVAFAKRLRDDPQLADVGRRLARSQAAPPRDRAQLRLAAFRTGKVPRLLAAAAAA